MLSITVPVFNHEKYVIKALDSIKMQKTKYTFEVLIGEDCSTDNTRAILKEYQKTCPDNFIFLYREKNMHGNKITNGIDLKLRTKGKYTITLEGDDYWLDSNKIEKQVSFLENNPKYIASAHNCVVVDEESMRNEETYPECKECEYGFDHYLFGVLPGQTTTVMMHNIYNKAVDVDRSILQKGLIPGDRVMYFVLMCYGKIYCHQEAMSAYRHVTKSGSSFSATNTFDAKRELEWYNEILQYAKKIKHNKGIVYSSCQLFFCIKYCVLHGFISLKTFSYYIRKINFSPNFINLVLKCKFIRIKERVLQKIHAK